MLRTSVRIIATLGLLGCNADSISFGQSEDRTFEVTLTNLSDAQPISPGVFVLHDNSFSLFAGGEAASAGIQAIAESGDPSVAVAELSGAPGIGAVVASDEPAHRVGGSGSQSVIVTLTADDDHTRLSMATMLICTNDGFVSARSLPVPTGTAGLIEVDLVAYDAGTEANSESAGDIVPPCWSLGPVSGPAGGSGRTAEGGTVALHQGVTESGDLSAAHRWTSPAAKITIRRIE